MSVHGTHYGLSAVAQMTTADAALFYAERLGFRVIPIPHGQKRPHLSNWQQVATSDPEGVRRLFIGHQGNIGIVCGPESRIIVIDVDPPDGCATLSGLEEQLGPLPATLTEKTGRG